MTWLSRRKLPTYLKKFKEDRNQMLEEYVYLKPRIEDYLYIQTSNELDTHRVNCGKFRLEENQRFQKMRKDFSKVASMLYDDLELFGFEDDV